jgi:hypothetical protein
VFHTWAAKLLEATDDELVEMFAREAQREAAE